ncbi:MAG TPA: hypothetical protein VF381_14090 [Thermoanaerobaculia bacterium]
MRKERLAKGTDHCDSRGPVHLLGDLVQEGQIVDPASKRPLTTHGTSGSRRRVLIYAVSSDFEIHVGFDGTRGQENAVKHETLFHNADVRAAGELEVVGGIIYKVNDFSGSYRTAGKLDTDRRFAEAVLTACDRSSAQFFTREYALREKAGRR